MGMHFETVYNYVYRQAFLPYVSANVGIRLYAHYNTSSYIVNDSPNLIKCLHSINSSLIQVPRLFMPKNWSSSSHISFEHFYILL